MLYRNDGDGTFTDSGQAANSFDNQGATWGDYDGDGDLDLYVVNTAPNALYRNDAGVLTLLSGVAVDASSGRGATWGDYDDDGDLDLYVTNYSKAQMFRTCCIATTAVTRLSTCRLGRAWPRPRPV